MNWKSKRLHASVLLIGVAFCSAYSILNHAYSLQQPVLQEKKMTFFPQKAQGAMMPKSSSRNDEEDSQDREALFTKRDNHSETEPAPSKVQPVTSDSPNPFPRFIIHAGPHKTGSTSIQQALLKLSEPLQKDNLVSFWNFHSCGTRDYGRHKNPALVPMSFQPRLCGSNSHADRRHIHRQLSQHISQSLQSNSNFLLSSEEFAEPEVNLTLFSEILGQIDSQHFDPHTQTQIILYHRPVLQWLSSLYFEIHRPKSGRQIPPPFPSLVEWLTNSEHMDHVLQKFATNVAQRFRNEGFLHIDIRPFTSDNTDDFLCNSIAAPRTCQVWRQQKQQQASGPKQTRNSKFSLEYLRVYHVAVQQGHIPAGIHDENPKRARKLLNMIRQRLEKQASSSSLRHICISGELRQRLTDLALAIALNKVTPNENENPTSKKSTANTSTTTTIDDMLDQLCSLDVEHLLKNDTAWQASWFQRQSFALLQPAGEKNQREGNAHRTRKQQRPNRMLPKTS